MPRKLTRAGKVIAFIETFCLIPEGAHIGKPMRLEPFQKRFIKEVFDNPAGTRTAILSIARKNGKSGLIAALLLTFLVGPEAKRNAQLVSGAMSRDQASLVFNLAAKMIRLSDRLSRIVKIIPSGKRLIGLPMATEYHALAADGTTAQGLSPLLAILDEVGQVRGPTNEFVDAITTSQGAHEHPLLIAISTQAPTDADMFSLWIDDARTGADKTIVCHVYEAPKDCALDDPKAWKAANPALGVFRDLKDVELQAAKAVRMPADEPKFRNLILNQRVEATAPFVSRSVWMDCGGEVGNPAGYEVYMGLDLSARADLTALVLVWRDEESIWHVRPYVWTPEGTIFDRAKRDRAPYDLWHAQGHLFATPGSSVDYDFVAATVMELISTLNVRQVAFDRWRIDQFKQSMQRAGATDEDLGKLVAFGQGFISMAPALDALEASLLERRVRHGAHPVLTMCAANAVVVKDAAGNRKLDKSKATGRIDAMQALAMAMGAAAAHLAEQAVEVASEVW